MKDKLKSLVHYICHQNDSSIIEDAKLKKILILCEMLYFNKTGKKLTNEKYIKIK